MQACVRHRLSPKVLVPCLCIRVINPSSSKVLFVWADDLGAGVMDKGYQGSALASPFFHQSLYKLRSEPKTKGGQH